MAAGNYQITLTVRGNYGAMHSITKTVAIAPGETSTGNTGKVKGFVMDTDEKSATGVSVSLVEGTSNGTTDNSGSITLNNLPVGIPLHFKLTKTGYVNQVVALIISPDKKEAFFYVTLKKRNNQFTFQNAEFGGKVSGNDGGSMILPVDALIKPDGTAATGNVSVSVTPVDVARQTGAFPGTFQAVRYSGDEVVLLSLGVIEFNFQQGDKQLQLAPGKTATIVIPIYTSGAKAGDKIPLWSINENNGIWVEEGMGTVVTSSGSPTGLALQAEIGHLSWWNCDDFRNKKDKDALCWRWECTTAQCYRVKVGCWMSGARQNDEGSKKSLEVDHHSMKSYHLADAVPPVFEARAFVDEGGSKLMFPEDVDVYLVAQGYGSQGELLKGNLTIKGGKLPDTIKVELSNASVADTVINLNLNQQYNYNLKKGKMVQFKVNIPESNVYGFVLDQGTYRWLNGMYNVIQSQVLKVNGGIDGRSRYVLLAKGEILINVNWQYQDDEGNFSIQVLAPTSLMLNTTISDSLTTSQKFKLYSFSPDSNNILLTKFKTLSKVYGGRIKIFSQSNKLIKEEAVYELETSIIAPVSKDSIYYFEIKYIEKCKFSLTISYDEKYRIAYGDTLRKKLRYRYDADHIWFTGKKNEFVSINGIQTDYILSGGLFELLDNEGHLVARKKLSKSNYDDEDILYTLPSDGVYSIFVTSSVNDTGSYQIVLHNPVLNSMSYNSILKVNTLPDKEYYYQFDLSQKKYTHFSIISENERGNFDIWDENCRRFSNRNFYSRNSKSSDFNPVNDSLAAGKYYIKITNQTATAIHLTLKEITPLIYNSKGKAQFTDTIKVFTTNTYLLNGKPGDGFQAISKRINEASVPSELFVNCHNLGDNDYLSIQGIAYRRNTTLDSSQLVELATKLPGKSGSLTWVISVRAEKQGVYDFNLHYVKSSDSIAVDDDFAECPGAHTSSLIAAGFAIKDNGKIYIANGTYKSFYPLAVSAKNVKFTGQQKELVKIVNTDNYFQVLKFEGEGFNIKNITIKGGTDSDAIYLGGNNSICENIDVRPFKDAMGGKFKGIGSNITFRNIKFENTREGIQIGSENGLVENCDITSQWLALSAYGKPIKIVRNRILITNTGEAIVCGGIFVCDSNQIEIRTTINADDQIMEFNGNSSSGASESYVRNNTILTSQTSRAFRVSAGNPDTKIFIENNQYKSTYSKGGRAFSISTQMSKSAGSVIVRNNVFEGVTSNDAVSVQGMDVLTKSQIFGIYNNSFRMAPGALKDTTYHFLSVYKNYTETPADTCQLFIANNIFQGNNFSSWINVGYNYTFFSDYNVLYNFRKYKNKLGNIIGNTNDIAVDPMFTDDKLHIAPTSPAINKGTSSTTLFPMLPTKDINGIGRPLGSAYDIGAYEVK